VEAALLAGIAPKAGGRVDLDHVRGEILRGAGRRHVSRPADQRLARQEADGQLLVLAGRAHGDRDRRAVHADLQRFLDRDLVALTRARPGGDTFDPRERHVRVDRDRHAVQATPGMGRAPSPGPFL
jgi:hypothetical protein